MSKLDAFLWWANIEVYRSGVDFENKTNSDSGFVRRPSSDELDNYCIGAGLRKYEPTGHWCGIFQTYLMKKAGINCHWVISKGIKIEAASKHEIQEDVMPAAGKDLALGDILIVQHNDHHIMVLEPTRSGYIPSIEGNAKGINNPALGAFYTGNALHNVVSKIQKRYRIVT
jgi:hypothetical protein